MTDVMWGNGMYHAFQVDRDASVRASAAPPLQEQLDRIEAKLDSLLKAPTEVSDLREEVKYLRTLIKAINDARSA